MKEEDETIQVEKYEDDKKANWVNVVSVKFTNFYYVIYSWTNLVTYLLIEENNYIV